MRKSTPGRREVYHGQHRFEHWYRDNTVYFITARCRDRFPALESEQAKQIFWDRFEHYTAQHGFVPWVTTTLDNHYHSMGYMYVGAELGEMMRKIHGSVAKLVNDLLPERRVPFWRDNESKDYFDGCLRNELQVRRTFRYVLLQSVRHGICKDYREYPHTRVRVELERGLRRALELNALLPSVPYKRYQKRPPGAGT